MTLELHARGILCNLICGYCYQNPMRDAGNFGDDVYDLEAMKKALASYGTHFTLFGGEPLLMPIDDLADLWKWGFEKWGQNGMQTNGTLITERHFELFRQYRVGVGISLDGPDELNDSRWAGSLEKTRAATAKSQANLERLCREGCYVRTDKKGNTHKSGPSLIITVYRKNAALEVRGRFKTWIKELDAMGLQAARLHPLEVDNDRVESDWQLSADEQIDFFLDMAMFEKELTTIKFDIFRDERLLLEGKDGPAICIWNACDPYTTDAVSGVGPDGSKMNCGRTNKDGVNYVKADRPGFERQLALYETPFEADGCSGCRFFIMCKGNCPGTALSSDWRNRTNHCAMLLKTFEHFERELLREGKAPLSLSSQLPQLERIMLAGWAEGRNMRVRTAVEILKNGGGIEPVPGGDHGDHYDAKHPTHSDGQVGAPATEHTDGEHGDYTDHGDSDNPDDEPHGDSEHGDESTVTSFHGDSDQVEDSPEHGDHTNHGDQES